MNTGGKKQVLFDAKHSLCNIKQPIIVSKENGNQHILNNKSQCNVYQFRIDGGIISSSKGERCDYIVEAEKVSGFYAYIIELKGSDLNKAISQIQNTISIYREQLKTHVILPRIVIHKTATHDIRGKKYRDLKRLYPGTIVKDKKYDLDCV